MKVLPSTWVIFLLGVAVTAIGIYFLAADDPKGEFDGLGWGLCSIMFGVPLAIGAFARNAILLAPPNKYRRAINTGLLGGLGIGGGADGGGDGSGGGDGGGGGH